jgi:hypothetical protein
MLLELGKPQRWKDSRIDQTKHRRLAKEIGNLAIGGRSRTDIVRAALVPSVSMRNKVTCKSAGASSMNNGSAFRAQLKRNVEERSSPASGLPIKNNEEIS